MRELVRTIQVTSVDNCRGWQPLNENLLHIEFIEIRRTLNK